MSDEVYSIGRICPRCDSHQFSINPLPVGLPDEDFPDNVIGIGDCRNCGNFLVKLAPELKQLFTRKFKLSDNLDTTTDIIEKLFK